MEFENPLPEKFQEGFEKDLLLIAASLILVAGSAGLTNYVTPEDRMDVGMVEIETECHGIDAGVCIGLEKQQQVTYNYADYEVPEEGTANYYRRVESELMAQAYSICESGEVSGYEWTSEAGYENRTGSEWRQMEEVSLLPCENSYFRKLNATS
jgi:hypothetical protein